MYSEYNVCCRLVYIVNFYIYNVISMIMWLVIILIMCFFFFVDWMWFFKVIMLNFVGRIREK